MVVLLLFCSVLFRSVFFGEQLEKQDTLTEIYRKQRHGMACLSTNCVDVVLASIRQSSIYRGSR